MQLHVRRLLSFKGAVRNAFCHVVLDMLIIVKMSMQGTMDFEQEGIHHCCCMRLCYLGSCLDDAAYAVIADRGA